MGRPRISGTRVYGPYAERGGRDHRLIIADAEGAQASGTFPTREEALATKRWLERELGAEADGRVTISKAVEEYIDDLREGRKESTVATTRMRLTGFFAPAERDLLTALDLARCQELYDGYRTTPTKKTKRPPADSTQLNVFEEVLTFGDWLAYEKKWLRENPFLGVKTTGSRSHGKEQLRIDEARRWDRAALVLADKGGHDLESALAATFTFVLGLREFEVLAREVRDVDDNGRLLWIPISKTENGRRFVEIPRYLVPYVRKLVEGKPARAPLFPYARGWVSAQVARICELAGLDVSVGSQSMRGLHGTASIEAGATSRDVARTLGHGSPTVSEKSYIEEGAIERARVRRVVEMLGHGEEGDS